MPEEVTVTIPTPPPPSPAPSTDHSLAIALGEMKAAQQAQHDVLMEILHRLGEAAHPAPAPATEMENRIERLEAQNESEIETPPPVSEIILPAPEHHELPTADPITPESTPLAVPEKRFLGMLHAW